MASDNIDALIEETGGCGRFQILLVMACWVSELSLAWNMIVMAFAVYNPGMECVTTDLIPATGVANVSTPASLPIFSNLSLTGLAENPDLNTRSENLTMQYQEKNSTFAEKKNICDYPGEIKFKKSASTIVTEWSLVCDRVWISSIIISLQMAGALLGSPLSGQIALRFGRKVAVYGSLASNAVLNFVAFFSVSWTMFAVLRFFMGLSYGASSFLYCTEFLTYKWRGYLSVIPDYNISCIILSLVLMALRDWRNLHLTIGAVALLACLPAIWAPESMRWLAVRGEVSKASKIAKKIATTNKKQEPDTDVLMKQCDNDHGQPHRFLDLFRGGLHISSIVMGFVWFTLSVIFYGVSFGIKALFGNFYINFLALNIFAIPAKFSGAFVVNRLGRRLSVIVYFSLGATACVGIVGVHFLVPSEYLAGTIITVLAIFCHTCVTTAWGICMPWVTELYPTTIRSLAYGWVNFMANIGGIVSPYMHPKGTVPVYGSFIAMGFLIICSILSLLRLTETKGKPLQDIVLKQTSVLPDKSEEKAEKSSDENRASDNITLHGEGKQNNTAGLRNLSV